MVNSQSGQLQLKGVAGKGQKFTLDENEGEYDEDEFENNGKRRNLNHDEVDGDMGHEHTHSYSDDELPAGTKKRNKSKDSNKLGGKGGYEL